MSLKSDLIKRLIKKNLTLKSSCVKSIVGFFFSQMISSLKKGERIEIRGLGSFSIRDYTTNNDRLSKESYNKVYFRPSKKLIKEINKVNH